MVDVSLSVLLSLGGILVSAGAAYGGAKSALNGTRQRVKDMDEAFREHAKADDTHQRAVIDRLARIETKLDERAP